MQKMRLSERVRKVKEVAITSLAFAIASELTKDTPVKTGLARSNWSIVPGLSAGVAQRTPASVMVNIGRLLTEATQVIGAKSISVVNPVPYVVALNYGSSRQQAVPGYIQTAIKRALGSFRSSFSLSLDEQGMVVFRG